MLVGIQAIPYTGGKTQQSGEFSHQFCIFVIDL